MVMKNIDQTEINKFNKHAARWWDKEGDLKSLHDINPLRLGFIAENTNLNNSTLIDVGCGGGILTEALAKSGANATGIDMSDEALKVARLHALDSGLSIDYEHITVEEMAAKKNASFDTVTCLEMLEHVPDPASVVKACATLVKPGGNLFFSTLNRNPKSYLFAILGAEYILQLLPRGTHDYQKFIKPSELDAWLRDCGCEIVSLKGMDYNPLSKNYSLTSNVSVNYLVYARKI